MVWDTSVAQGRHGDSSPCLSEQGKDDVHGEGLGAYTVAVVWFVKWWLRYGLSQ